MFFGSSGEHYLDTVGVRGPKTIPEPGVQDFESVVARIRFSLGLLERIAA